MQSGGLCGLHPQNRVVVLLCPLVIPERAVVEPSQRENKGRDAIDTWDRGINGEIKGSEGFVIVREGLAVIFFPEEFVCLHV